MAVLPCLLLAWPQPTSQHLGPLGRGVLLQNSLGCSITGCARPSQVQLLKNKVVPHPSFPSSLPGCLLSRITTSSPWLLSTSSTEATSSFPEKRQQTPQGEEMCLGQHSVLSKGHSRRVAQQWGSERAAPIEGSPPLLCITPSSPAKPPPHLKVSWV